jgi:uncharacterized protein YoxC
MQEPQFLNMVNMVFQSLKKVSQSLQEVFQSLQMTFQIMDNPNSSDLQLIDSELSMQRLITHSITSFLQRIIPLK